MLIYIYFLFFFIVKLASFRAFIHFLVDKLIHFVFLCIFIQIYPGSEGYLRKNTDWEEKRRGNFSRAALAGYIFFNSAEYSTTSKTVACKQVQNFRPPRSFDFQDFYRSIYIDVINSTCHVSPVVLCTIQMVNWMLDHTWSYYQMLWHWRHHWHFVMSDVIVNIHMC